MIGKFSSKERLYLEISFMPVSACIEGDELVLEWRNTKLCMCLLNLPILAASSATAVDFQVIVSGKKVSLRHNLNINTQYGWCRVYQSQAILTDKWQLRCML